MAPSPPACPCGSDQPFAQCCGPLLDGQPAANAEALMRSRYVAYVLGNADYLRATWAAETRPEVLDLAAAPVPTWLGLTVKRHVAVDASHATVEFVARYRIGGRGHRLHETSRFERRDGRWYYLDGEIRD